ncbi:hypothetical protein MKW98_028514 [Papaver atlanticum]|uniref:Uncharacterized protein n=1 Tax=Papaver atlanticum TaxID=357466 RepID=A0AAD4TEI7_9MAGN|nr:hypothetical protein MKW98_028514 [Papaver atlanticum]
MPTVRYNLIVDVRLFLNFDSNRSVFDRGKDIDLILGVFRFPPFDFTFGPQMQVWFLDFVLIVLTTLGDNDDGSKLLANVSRWENFTNCLLMFRWMRVGVFDHAFQCLCGCEWVKFRMLARRPAMGGAAIFLLQLKCGLLVGITIQSCALLLFFPTCLLGLQFILGDLLLHVMRFPMGHGYWFRSYFISAVRVFSHLLNVKCSAAELVGTHVYTSMLLLTPSRRFFRYFSESVSLLYPLPTSEFLHNHIIPQEGVQVFLNSVIRTGPCCLHYDQHELYGCIPLWSLKGSNCFSLYLVYTYYLFDRGKGFDGYIFMDSYSGTSAYEFVLDHGYQLDLLQAALIMFLFVQLSVEAENSSNSGLYLFFLWFPSEVCARLATHEKIVLQVPQSICSSLHLFCPSWYVTHCCKDLTIFSKLDLSEYYLPCYPAIWNGDSQLNEVLVFTHEMRSFAEILKHLKFNDWLTVKS